MTTSDLGVASDSRATRVVAVGAVTGGALARSGRLAAEHQRAPRMRSAFDEGNDERPYSTAG